MAATYDPINAERHKQWYHEDLTEVSRPIRNLLEAYSKVAPDRVVPHVNDIRARGFSANPYPCIGQYKFLSLTLLTHPMYPHILSRLKSSPSTTYLDMGCCFGQDLRQLVFDGVPSSQLMGLDIESQLMELGYEFFLDKTTLCSKFLVADIFQGVMQGALWTELEQQKVDILHCSAFFHLFPLPDQIRAAKNVAKLVKKGGMIVGRQTGSTNPSEVPAIKPGSTSFRRDISTFQGMWDDVGEATDTKWTVEGTLDEVGMTGGKNAVEDKNSRRMLFTVTRIG